VKGVLLLLLLVAVLGLAAWALFRRVNWNDEDPPPQGPDDDPDFLAELDRRRRTDSGD
jgi:hypothetical protein